MSGRLVAGLVALSTLTACARGGGGGGSASAGATAATASGTTSAVSTASRALIPPVPGSGPRVALDAALRPGDWAPSPFPNDRWTVADASRTTGKRVALPFATQTKLEARVAAGIGDLDGFGTSAPIMVRFEGPIDLKSVTRETVVVVNVEPGHASFGRVTALDVGSLSAHPVKRPPRSVLSALEPNASADDIVFRPGNRSTFYEDETDTLLLRPLVPLDEAAEHAVVLAGVRGTSGDLVRAPAAGTVLPGQAAGVQRALSVIASLKLKAPVSFAWTFTTQSITATPLALSEGLHGRGPFASLAAAYPPVFTKTQSINVSFFTGLLQAAQPIAAAIVPITSPGSSVSAAANMLATGLYDFDSVEHVVFGSFRSPSFVKGGGGRFAVSVPNGTAKEVPDEVTFLVAVPKPTAANGFKQPPYPCVVFGHGIDRCRLDGLSVATRLARAGYATVAIDAFGHGPDDTIARSSLLKSLFPPLGEGRAVDVDGDGFTDSGAIVYDADATATRDVLRQTALDTVQLCRILAAQPAGSEFGGAGNAIHYVGQSLGTVIGAEILALAPEIDGAVLNVAGSALVNDVVTTSEFAVVADRLPRLSWGVAVTSPQVAPGSAVTLTNSAIGASSSATATASGDFFAAVKADPGDPLVLDVVEPSGAVKKIALAAPSPPRKGGGLGLVRNTPAWRSYLGVAAMAFDGADSVNFAKHWRTSPLPGRTAKRVLVQLSRNDLAMPTAAGINLARAAGLLSPQRDELLRTLGLPYGRSTANVDRDHGVESTKDFGLRFFCVDSHTFLNLPNDAIVDGWQYTVAAQDQIATFLATGAIDDSAPILKR